MEQHKLDAIDLRILSELQANGRITNVELSRRAKITAPPCLRRMRGLEKAGYIRGYHADIEPRLLGYEVSAYVFVGLSSQAEGDLKRFEEQVRASRDEVHFGASAVQRRAPIRADGPGAHNCDPHVTSSSLT